MLDLSGESLLFGVHQLKALAQKNPEAAAAKFSQGLVEIIAVWRVATKLNDGDAAAGLLPVGIVEFPSAEHRILIALFTGGEIDVKISFVISQQIAMRPIIGILPDLQGIATGQSVDTCIFEEVSLDHLGVSRLTNGTESDAGICNHSLAALGCAAQ